MSSSAIRAGRAFVEILADDSKARAVLKRFQAHARSWGATMNSIGRQIFVAGAAGAGGLLTLAKTASGVASKLVDLSGRTGIAVESLSQLKFAAEQSGAELDDLEIGVKKMSRTIAEAALGSDSAAEALGHLGLQAGQLIAMAPDKQFELLADRIASIPNPTFRAALALEIFGKSGTKLLPMMAGGAAGLKEFRKQADALGVTLSTKDAAALEAWGDQLDALRAVLRAGTLQIGAALLPTLVNLTTRVTDLAGRTIRWVGRNRELVSLFFKVAVGGMLVGGALMALAVALKVTGLAVLPLLVGLKLLRLGSIAIGVAFKVLAGIATTTFGIVAGAIGLLFTPLGLVVATIAGLGIYILIASGAFQRMIAGMGKGWSSLTKDTKAWWGILKDALAAGEIETAFEATTLFLQIQWGETMNFFRSEWADFVRFFVDIWEESVTRLATGKALFEPLNWLVDKLNNLAPPDLDKIWPKEGLGPAGGGKPIQGGAGKGGGNAVGHFSVPPEPLVGVDRLRQNIAIEQHNKKADIRDFDQQADHKSKLKPIDDEINRIRDDTKRMEDERAKLQKNGAKADAILNQRPRARFVVGGPGVAAPDEAVRPSANPLQGVIARRQAVRSRERDALSAEMKADLDIENKRAAWQAEGRKGYEKKTLPSIAAKRAAAEALAAEKQAAIPGHVAQIAADRTKRARDSFDRIDETGRSNENLAPVDKSREPTLYEKATNAKHYAVGAARRELKTAKLELAVLKRKKHTPEELATAKQAVQTAQQTFDTTRKTPAMKFPQPAEQAQASTPPEEGPLKPKTIILPSKPNETAEQILERENEQARMQREENDRVAKENRERKLRKDRNRWDVVRKQAQAAREGTNVPGSDGYNPRLGEDLAGAKTSSVGTFSGLAASGLGGGDWGAKIASNTAEAVKQLKKLNQNPGLTFE